jgi:hypothetical protein
MGTSARSFSDADRHQFTDEFPGKAESLIISRQKMAVLLLSPASSRAESGMRPK